ncbi:MAG: Gfo/Idh/MocA family protein [Halobacteriales archaeon]
MTHDLIHVGAGDQGLRWLDSFIPANEETGHVNLVGVVDPDEDALSEAEAHADLPADRFYADLEEALSEHDADAVSNVTPPPVHEDVVDAAIDHDVHVISEKPIAHTLESSVRIAEKVERAGLKMGITMSHRFRQDVTSLRRRIRSGAHGDVDYLVGRYAVNARSYGWVDRLYDWDEHPMLIDGSVHHLDLLADLAGGTCETVFAHSWNPAWSEFDGDPNAVVTMVLDNGTRVTYEGSNTNAVSLNGWGNEHVRAECENATLILDGHEIRRFEYDPEGENCLENNRFEDGERVQLEDGEKWSNAWLIEQFAEWLDGGPEMETNVRDNLQSMAMVYGAIESAETGESVRVQDLLEETRERVDVT